MNYHSDEWIMEGLQRHFEEAKKTIPKERIVAIILKGSQNCGLDTELSDIDSNCIYIPSIEELSNHTDYRPKYTITLSNGEIISFLDIRYFNYALTLRSIYYLESLYSQYYICPNSQYKHIWHQYRTMVNDLVESNKPAVIKSLNFYVNEHGNKISDNFHPSRRIIGYTNGYDGKTLYWVLRCYIIAHLMLIGRPFSDCSNEQINQWVRAAKENQYSAVSAYQLNRFLLTDFKRISEKVITLYPIDEENNSKLMKKLKELEKEVLYDYYGEGFSTL